MPIVVGVSVSVPVEASVPLHPEKVALELPDAVQLVAPAEAQVIVVEESA